MLYNIIDSDAKFQYDHEVSEEVLYQMFYNTIYFYQLIINLAFDQEKELRMRFFDVVLINIRSKQARVILVFDYMG